MTALKPEKCCFCINWKVVCYIFVYFILALQTRTIQYSVATVQYYFARVIDVDITPDSSLLPEVILFIVVTAGFLIAIAIGVVVFNIIMLFGLFTENWKFLKMYLIFSTMMLVLYTIVCIFAEFIMERESSESIGNSISIACNAYFLYVIRSFWLSIDPYSKSETGEV